MIPWDTVCVDLVGPYTVTDHTGTDHTLMAMAFIDPATGWFEIAKLPNKEKSSVRIGQLFKTPRGWHATHVRGKSFLTMDQSSRKTSCHY